MKVYVIISTSVYEGEIATNIKVFSNVEKAKENFNKMVVDSKENDHLMDYEDVVIEEEEMQFTIYESGRYSEDHYSVWIEEQEVIEEEE